MRVSTYSTGRGNTPEGPVRDESEDARSSPGPSALNRFLNPLGGSRVRRSTSDGPTVGLVLSLLK